MHHSSQNVNFTIAFKRLSDICLGVFLLYLELVDSGLAGLMSRTAGICVETAGLMTRSAGISIRTAGLRWNLADLMFRLTGLLV